MSLELILHWCRVSHMCCKSSFAWIKCPTISADGLKVYHFQLQLKKSWPYIFRLAMPIVTLWVVNRHFLSRVPLCRPYRRELQCQRLARCQRIVKRSTCICSSNLVVYTRAAQLFVFQASDVFVMIFLDNCSLVNQQSFCGISDTSSSAYVTIYMALYVSRHQDFLLFQMAGVSSHVQYIILSHEYELSSTLKLH